MISLLTEHFAMAWSTRAPVVILPTHRGMGYKIRVKPS